MLTPYFQRDGITIYHGDCREVAPQLAQADIVHADPPYGIDYQSAWRPAWARKDTIAGDDSFPLWLFELFTPAVALFVWCRWDTLPMLPLPKSLVVWDKGAHSMGDLDHEFARQWEACAFYPGAEHAFAHRPKDIIRFNKVPAAKLLHPNEKPVGAISPLLSCHKATSLLDPFMGSGSSLLAAKRCGMRAVGIELDERYCEIAADRLRQKTIAWPEAQKVPPC